MEKTKRIEELEGDLGNLAAKFSEFLVQWDKDSKERRAINERVRSNADKIAHLEEIDGDRKAALFLLKSVAIELSNVLVDEHDKAIEEKVRKRVDKLRSLVNPLR